MAVVYRFYSTRRIGTGSSRDPFRSALYMHVKLVPVKGRPLFISALDSSDPQLVLTRAQLEDLKAADADPRCEAMSPPLKNEYEVEQWLASAPLIFKALWVNKLRTL